MIMIMIMIMTIMITITITITITIIMIIIICSKEGGRKRFHCDRGLRVLEAKNCQVFYFFLGLLCSKIDGLPTLI